MSYSSISFDLVSVVDKVFVLLAKNNKGLQQRCERKLTQNTKFNYLISSVTRHQGWSSIHISDICCSGCLSDSLINVLRNIRDTNIMNRLLLTQVSVMFLMRAQSNGKFKTVCTLTIAQTCQFYWSTIYVQRGKIQFADRIFYTPACETWYWKQCVCPFSKFVLCASV